MVIIPAVDLKDGCCVRLRQGRMDESVVFSEDPLATCERWLTAGASRIHVVDLDGAVLGKPAHQKTIREILKHYPDISLQIGGGIRDEKTVESYLEIGAKWVVLGTVAVNDPDFVAHISQRHPGRIIIGLDERDGYAATAGWKEQTQLGALEIAKNLSRHPLAAFIHTDINRDGMMQGVNVDSSAKMAQAVSVPVIASGGVHRLDDIHALKESGCIYGAIIGRALYQGDIDLGEALSAAAV